ncbi:LamG-like jellyroll fold domain-containing protein, partial [Alienimonas sp. DA493]|uniref:LamG-like jellyroll fold domain-containing protein n=1 Tax=Alienimonas sp. DA493 TaxID=3373605 RepID=UPI003754F245
AVGAPIRTGTYELNEGFVRFALPDGVRVTVSSPARFRVESGRRLYLDSGRLSAVVPPSGIGFAVETPTVDLVDYGTEFGVDVAADRTSEIHVFDGVVEVDAKGSPAGVPGVRLTTDQATRVRGSSRIPEGIDVDHQRFVRTLEETPDADPVYQDLLDRLGPDLLFRMAVPEDGVTLADGGPDRGAARVVPGAMREPPFRPGRVGGALHLGGPGEDAYAVFNGYRPATDDALTVCAWVMAGTRPRWAAIAKNWDVEYDTRDGKKIYRRADGQFHFGLKDDDGDLEVQVRDRRGEIVDVREGEPLPIGVWQHVAFVVDGETLRLYRNGVERASAPCDGLATDAPPHMGIGAKLHPGGLQPDFRNPGFWHGRIDELAIYHRALSPEQIAALYAAPALDDSLAAGEN